MALPGWLGYDLGTSGTATQSTIRDRILDLIEALDPISETRSKFRRHRNEGDGEFQTWCDSYQTACLRRFQVEDFSLAGPSYSNTDVDMRECEMVISVAYPQTQRFGEGAALSRRTVIEQDFGEIEKLMGIYGRAWFFSEHDCTPLGLGEPQFDIQKNDGYDLLVIRARFSYYRSVTPVA